MEKGSAKANSGAAGFAGAVAAMKVPAYRDFTLGYTVAVIGTWLQRVVTGWLVWELTRSPGWLGALVFIDLLVTILTAPLAGAVADRASRLHVMIAAQSILIVHAALMAVLYALGWLNIHAVLALAVVSGIGQGFHGAGRSSLLPGLVPKALLAPAIGINALTFNVARFIGPAIAGFIISTWGLPSAIGVNALFCLPFIWVLSRLHLVTPDDMRKPAGGLLQQIGEGMDYAVRHPGIGPLILIMGVTAFSVRALPDMLPGFAADVFGRGASGLAWLTSSMGVGATVGGIMMARRSGTQGMTRRLVGNFAVMTLAILAFVVSQTFWMGVASIVVVGYVLSTNGASSQTLIQSAVDGAMRGRVMSIYTLVYQGAPALGGLILGNLAVHIGLRGAFAGGAAICALACLWMWRHHGAMGAALEIPEQGADARKAAE
ncbi:MAG TPA: MFS transporter [Alphaproteobacteria bacterium]|nr:MFS transporter [Alphaproteobacteria bacterium]